MAWAHQLCEKRGHDSHEGLRQVTNPCQAIWWSGRCASAVCCQVFWACIQGADGMVALGVSQATAVGRFAIQPCWQVVVGAGLWLDQPYWEGWQGLGFEWQSHWGWLCQPHGTVMHKWSMTVTLMAGAGVGVWLCQSRRRIWQQDRLRVSDALGQWQDGHWLYQSHWWGWQGWSLTVSVTLGVWQRQSCRCESHLGCKRGSPCRCQSPLGCNQGSPCWCQSHLACDKGWSPAMSVTRGVWQRWFLTVSVTFAV